MRIPFVLTIMTILLNYIMNSELAQANSHRLIQPARRFNNFVTNLCLTFNNLSVIIIMERGKERMTDENDMV